MIPQIPIFTRQVINPKITHPLGIPTFFSGSFLRISLTYVKKILKYHKAKTIPTIACMTDNRMLKIPIILLIKKKRAPIINVTTKIISNLNHSDEKLKVSFFIGIVYYVISKVF